MVDVVACGTSQGEGVVGLQNYISGKDVQPVVRDCIVKVVDEIHHPSWELLVHDKDPR